MLVSLFWMVEEQEYMLQKQLNKDIRFIFSLPKDAHISPYLKNLHWLPLVLRREYFLLTMTFNVIKFKRPTYLYANFEPHIILINTEATQTRSNDFFKIPVKTKTIYDNSYTISAMKAWNSLPYTFREIQKIDNFKIAVKDLLYKRFINSEFFFLFINLHF